MSSLKFDYGDLVKAESQNVQGTIVGYNDSVHNQRKWIVSIPMIGTDVEYENESTEWSIDESALTLIKKGSAKQIESCKFVESFDHILGKKVVHIPTKVTGILTEVITHGNNATLVCVETNRRSKLNGKLLKLFCYIECITSIDEPSEIISVTPVVSDTLKLCKEDQVTTDCGMVGAAVGYAIDISGNIKYVLDINKVSDKASIENDSTTRTVFPWTISKIERKENAKQFDIEFSFELGQKVEYKVTETDGFIINKTMHLNDCRYYTVVFEDPNPITNEFITEQIPEALLTLVKEPTVIEQKDPPIVKRGGPRTRLNTEEYFK